MSFNNINILQYNHLRLVTLGRLALSAAADSPAAALARQRRKLAVLGFLALSKRPVSRETLKELFWGDRDEARASHSLSEALSHLRRVLGPTAITLRQAEVSLSREAPISIDAVEFAAAAERGDDARALSLYAGPFLGGVYLGGSSRFEEWADRERRRLELLFLEVCRRRCAQLSEAGAFGECASVAERWLAADPLSESAMLTLLNARLAAGTSDADARVVQEFERLRQRLRAEYELDLPGPVAARINEIAARLVVPAQAAVLPKPIINVRRSWRPLAASAALVLMLISGTLAFWPAAERSPTSTAVVAVLPFTIHAPDEHAYLREGVVDLLSANLDGAGRFRTVDPRTVLTAANEEDGTSIKSARAVAGRLGAELYVIGDVVVAGDQVRMSAALYQRGGSGPTARARVEGRPQDLFQMVDQLTAQLLASSAGVTPDPMGRLAALTTASLPALKHYLRGETEYRRGRYVQAFEAFRAAAREDTSFALAHFRLAHAARWAPPVGWTWDSLVDRSRIAQRHAGRLSTRPRLLVHGYHAWATGRYDEAERAYRTVTRLYPEELEAWYQLGEVLFHTNPVRGRSILEARAALERVIALEPTHLGALTHLVRIAARQGRRAEMDSLLTQLMRLQPKDQQVEFKALRGFLLENADAEKRIIEELRGADDEQVRAIAHRVAVYGGRLDGAMQLLPLLTRRAASADARGHAHLWLADLEVAHGRWRRARAQLDSAAMLDATIALERRALLESLPFGPASKAELLKTRSALLRLEKGESPARYPWLAVYDGLHASLRSYMAGIVAVRLAEPETSARHADALGGLPTKTYSAELSRALGESLRGHIAASEGRYDAALAAFDAGRFRAPEGFMESEFGSQALERWERAEILYRLERFDDALAWYSSLPEISIHGLIYLAPVHLRKAQIADRRGQAALAKHHYTHFVALWQYADDELQPQVAAARRRLATLP